LDRAVKHSRLERIAEALSNGEPVDWGTVRRRFSGEIPADYLAQLETLSKFSAAAAERDRPHEDVAEPFWVRLVLAFAFVQIAFGILGALAYREYSYINFIRLLMLVSFAAMGALLRWSRSSVRARDLGAVLVLFAFGFSRTPFGLLLDAWLPESVLRQVLWRGLAVDAWAGFFIWRFAQRFPTTVRFTTIDRVAKAAATIAATIGTLLFALNLASTLTTLPDWLFSFTLGHEEGQRYSGTIFLLTLPAVPVMLMRAGAAPADERDRVRIFALAMALGIAPLCLEVILEALFPRYTAYLRSSPQAQAVMVTVAVGPLPVLPIVTAYSVLVHRLLDIRIAVKRGVQYLLARWTLMFFVAAPFGLLASHVYERRHESIASVLTGGRGAVLLASGVAAAALFLVRGMLFRRLDRWFDRRDSDRHSVLARAGERFRLVRTSSELVSAVDAAAEGALNAPAEVCLYDASKKAYIPVGRGGLPLSGDSALPTMLTQEPSISAIRTDGERSIARLLPSVERLWLEGRQAGMVAPIREVGLDRPSGIVVFGARRDALGYSREDEQFVTALMASAAMALDNLRLKAEAVGGPIDDDLGALCVRCRLVVDSSANHCVCGGALQPASVPRCINGKFQIEALLGAGGMGVAYLGRDLALGRRVAMKTLPAVSAEGLARLGREARMMASLSHPNLATIFGHESWRGTPILVCEYLPNGTLKQRLASERPTTAASLALVLKLLDALEYMHERNVLHRDVKPSNVAFAADGTPKLLDFGLAGLIDVAQRPAGDHDVLQASLAGTTPAGTLGYLPPEALRGEAPTQRFDLWALTVVLFEMVVGRHPFIAGADTVTNISRGRLVVQPENTPGVPSAVAALLRDALRPARSFESCASMRAALHAAHAAAHEEVPYGR
jgi:hypothetical protein